MKDKKKLSERDICTKFITPALENAGWDKMTQFNEEVGLKITEGKIIVKGKLYMQTKTDFIGFSNRDRKNLCCISDNLPTLEKQSKKTHSFSCRQKRADTIDQNRRF